MHDSTYKACNTNVHTVLYPHVDLCALVLEPLCVFIIIEILHDYKAINYGTSCLVQTTPLLLIIVGKYGDPCC